LVESDGTFWVLVYGDEVNLLGKNKYHTEMRTGSWYAQAISILTLLILCIVI
jgi:hypothetical protein